MFNPNLKILMISLTKDSGICNTLYIFGHYITYIGEASQIVEFLKRCFSWEGSCTVLSVVSFAEKTFCCENIKIFDVTINIKCTPHSHSLFNHEHSPIKFPPFVKVFSPHLFSA